MDSSRLDDRAVAAAFAPAAEAIAVSTPVAASFEASPEHGATLPMSGVAVGDAAAGQGAHGALAPEVDGHLLHDLGGYSTSNLAIEETRRNLDLALTHMQQGLCLFDRQGALVLFNQRLVALLALRADMLQPGMRFDRLLRYISIDHTVSFAGRPLTSPQLRAKMMRRIDSRSDDVGMEFSYDGKIISVTVRPLPQGGWLSTLEDVTEQRETELRISYLAHHDTLTRLPNRVSFYDRMRKVLARPIDAPGEAKQYALLYLDLDRFKPVNDTYGHHIGDQLLKAVATRLQSSLRGADFLTRLGGDEFAIIQAPIQTVDETYALAQRCVDALLLPFDIAGNALQIGVSIGIVFGRTSFQDPDTVLRFADIALYQAKRDGRNIYRVYQDGMKDPLEIRRELENDLIYALHNGQFELHYQPIVEGLTGKITACEALLRWNSEKRGAVAPDAFIPVAEDMGLMRELGSWVLEQACRDASTWPTDVRVCVNVSPAQLQDDHYIGLVIAALTRTGLDASRLELEVTETALLERSLRTVDVLHRLRRVGVGIAMDDFGTGYSSLSLLHNFPFTRIKIDQRFIHGLGINEKSIAIIRAITRLCDDLAITAIGEGVETEAQKQVLLEQGCMELQGFLFSRPVTLLKIQSLVAQQ